MGFADLLKRASLKRPDLYYLAAGVIGLVAALIGAIGAPRIELANDPAAVVNGVPIPREALARAVLALESDSRNPVTSEREQAALERLIEEELLVQHGVDLGLAETDFAARRALVQSVIALAIAERAGEEPSEAELRRFYQDNAGFFAPPPRISGTVVYFREGTDAARVEAARAALARGERVAGDPMTIPVPRAALAPNEWRRLLGAGVGDAVAQLQPGQVSAPVPVSGGLFIIRADSFVAAPIGRYEDVIEQVRAEWQRRADDEAVRGYLERLKHRGRIERRLRGHAGAS